MIGLIVLFVVGVYLAISVLVVLWAIRFAKRKGRSPWLGGILAALFMYLLVFWDYIPTKIMFHHYCTKEAGVWIYKTIDQWKKENPGVAETLQAYTDKNRPDIISSGDSLHDYTTKEYLNPRIIIEENKKGTLLFNVFKRKYEIVDVKTGEIIARGINFSSGYGSNPFELGSDYGWKGFKVWLTEDNCPCSEKYMDNLFDYMDKIRNIAEI